MMNSDATNAYEVAFGVRLARRRFVICQILAREIQEE